MENIFEVILRLGLTYFSICLYQVYDIFQAGIPATASLFVLHTVPGKQEEDLSCSAHSIAVNNDSCCKSHLLFALDRNKASCKVIITWKEIMLNWDPRVLKDCHEAGSRYIPAMWQKYCKRSPRYSHEVSWEFRGRYIPIMTCSAATWNTNAVSPLFPCRQKMNPE